MGNKLHKNTLLRIQRVCDITRQHYEEGNLARCYKQVWRIYVYPIYPMCYHTYLYYLSVGLASYKGYKPYKAEPEYPTLFDDEDYQ